MLERGRGAIILMSSLLAVGCVATKIADPFAQTERLWPEDPSFARIALVGEFADATDLGISGSAWARIVSLTAGADKGRLIRPMAIAASGDGSRIYVADPDAACVHRFDIGKNRGETKPCWNLIAGAF